PVLIELAVFLGRRPAGAVLPGLATALRHSLRDPVPWIMVGVWSAYLASLPLLFPDYLGTVVPLVWNFYLDLGGSSAWQVLLTPRLVVATSLLLPLLFLAFRGRPVPLRTPGGALPALLALAA